MRTALELAGGWRFNTGAGPVSRTAATLLFATLAAGLLIGLSLADTKTIFLIGGSLLFVIAFSLSGNPRLFFLWGLVLSAPLAVSKAFFISAHMGGASAIRLDLCDVFLAALLFFILRDYLQGRRDHLRFSMLAFWWGGMIVLGVLNIIFGPLRMLALLEVVRMLKLYLLFFVIINEVVRVRQFMQMFAALAGVIVLQTSIAMVQFTLHSNLGLQFLGEPEAGVMESTSDSVYRGTIDVYRAGGLFEHPNILAGFLALLLPICIALMFSRLAPLYKAGLAAVIGLGLAVLMITLSRSGWMSFGAGFVLLLVVSILHQKLRLRYMLARVLVIISIFAALGMASGEIIKRFTASDPGALKFRYEMMDIAWEMIVDHPVLGLGLNTFVAYLPEYTSPKGPEAVNAKYGSNWPVVHDSYLITWTEQGTVGFAFLVGVYLCILWTAVKSARYVLDDLLYAINLGAACGIVAIMVDGIGSFFVAEEASGRVFWMIVGMIFAINYWTRANRHLRQGGAAGPAIAKHGARLVAPGP